MRESSIPVSSPVSAETATDAPAGLVASSSPVAPEHTETVPVVTPEHGERAEPGINDPEFDPFGE